MSAKSWYTSASASVWMKGSTAEESQLWSAQLGLGLEEPNMEGIVAISIAISYCSR